MFLCSPRNGEICREKIGVVSGGCGDLIRFSLTPAHNLHSNSGDINVYSKYIKVFIHCYGKQLFPKFTTHYLEIAYKHNTIILLNKTLVKKEKKPLSYAFRPTTSTFKVSSVEGGTR